MNEEEYNDCSVVAYPHEIRFLHIKGKRISYYVDRHVSDYVNKLQQENQKLKEEIERLKNEFYSLVMSEEEVLEREHLKRKAEER